MQSIQLSVDDEVVAIADGAAKEYADFSSKAGMSAEITDAIPMVIALAGNYAKLSADSKNPDDWAYLVKRVLDVVLAPKA